jgi:hypothetical protein
MVGTSPVRPEWTIRLDERDRSRCLAVQDDGTLGLATCGPSNNDQRFELRRGPLDTQDRPTYALVTRNPAAPGRLTWNPAGTRPRVTADPGPEDVQGWLFVDEGPSTLAD